MYEKIVVPLDGSELAETSLHYATQLAAKCGAELVLLHVCGPEECHCGPEECHVQPLHGVYTQDTAELIGGRLKDIGAKDARVTPVILVGDPTIEILRYVEENNIDLIAMATHGRSGIRRWVMGSVAVRIHRCSPVPVRLIRALSSDESAPEDWPEKRILVPLDGSDRAEQVLPYVVVHAHMSDSEVTLLRVDEPPSILSDYPEASMPLTWQEHVERATAHRREQCQLYVDSIAKDLRGKEINVKSECILGENASQEIIDYVFRNRPNLVAITTHARCALSAWPIGSTADKIIHATSSPILLVRPSQ